MLELYRRTHPHNKQSAPKGARWPLTFENPKGWTDVAPSPQLIFSHRSTYYTRATFEEGLHTHEYYELCIYVGGDVEYLCEDTCSRPESLCAVWARPYEMHTARLLSPSRYERYVLYFSPEFFAHEGEILSMTEFISNTQGAMLKIPEAMHDEVLLLLQKAENAAKSAHTYAALLLRSYLVRLFDLLNSPEMLHHHGKAFTDQMAKVKRYIDTEYASIADVGEIAAHFFYSREHLSRRFKEAFNVSVSEYLSRRRISESLALLQSESVASAAARVGFRSQSAYIAAFKRHIGCLPSAYKGRSL